MTTCSYCGFQKLGYVCGHCGREPPKESLTALDLVQEDFARNIAKKNVDYKHRLRNDPEFRAQELRKQLIVYGLMALVPVVFILWAFIFH
jgi:DNA-directed RNA polymerase subunit RPC12/RpoP